MELLSRGLVVLIVALTAPWVVEWDKKHNNTDVIYSMEKMN